MSKRRAARPAPRPVRLRIDAPAKINLTLRVLGTRPDGYRELRTMFQSLALHDTLTFTLSGAARRRGGGVEGSERTNRRGERFTISTNDPTCPTDSTNLVAKAAAQLWREYGRARRPPAVHVHIEKRIPSQAGLGGGSSDAAAALRTLPLLWRLRVPPERLAATARTLGADVSYFLEGGTALGVERGDVLFPLIDRPASHVVIILPDFGVSTRDAYAWWQEDANRGNGPSSAGTEWVNDLQRPVAARHPEIDRLTTALSRAGAAYAAMSGSGSAVFGLFDRATAAAAAAKRLGRPGYRIFVTRSISRAAYARAVRPRV